MSAHRIEQAVSPSLDNPPYVRLHMYMYIICIWLCVGEAVTWRGRKMSWIGKEEGAVGYTGSHVSFLSLYGHYLVIPVNIWVYIADECSVSEKLSGTASIYYDW